MLHFNLCSHFWWKQNVNKTSSCPGRVHFNDEARRLPLMERFINQFYNFFRAVEQQNYRVIQNGYTTFHREGALKRLSPNWVELWRVISYSSWINKRFEIGMNFLVACNLAANVMGVCMSIVWITIPRVMKVQARLWTPLTNTPHNNPLCWSENFQQSALMVRPDDSTK